MGVQNKEHHPAAIEHEEVLSKQHRPMHRGRVFVILALLAVSAVAFSIFVCWHRDLRIKNNAMDWARKVGTSIQKYYDEKKFIPPVLDEELVSLDHVAPITYPDKTDVARLRSVNGPFVLLTSKRCGLITPGADGCAAVVFTSGKITVKWMKTSEVNEERAKREALLAR